MALNPDLSMRRRTDRLLRAHGTAGRTDPSAHTPTLGTWASAHGLFDPRSPWLVPGLLLLATRLLLWSWLPLASEDAYITFRFARNLASGHGLVYNPGSKVFGFSSPTWTLWSALGTLLVHDPVLWARTTSVLADLATLAAMVWLLQRHASRASAWCFAVFYAAWPYFAAVSASGMENASMVALIALAAAANRSAWSGPLLAAVALMRPEGLAAAAVLAIGARWRDRAVALCLVAAAAMWLTLYFGSPIPQSLIAKSRLYGTPGPWVGRHWWEWLSPALLGRAPRSPDTQNLFVLSVVLAPALILGVRSLWRNRMSALALAIAACLAVWLVYAVLGVAYFWWYLCVPLAGFAALASVGFPSLARGRALYVSVALYVAGLWTLAPYLYVGRALNEMRGFAAVGEYLADHARPGDKVMAEPIGMIGYRAPLVVVDEIGLVSPAVARRRLEGSGWYADVARSERPDWLVVRASFVKAGDVFAGRGAPFRAGAERESLLTRYTVAAVIDTASHDLALAVLRRIR